MLSAETFDELEAETRPFRERKALEHESNVRAHKRLRELLEFPPDHELRAKALRMTVDGTKDRLAELRAVALAAGEPVWRKREALKQIRRLLPKCDVDLDDLLLMLSAHHSLSRWHQGRARGQRERIHNVKQCGHSSVIVSCRVCSKEHQARVGCGVGRLCVSCRGRQARKQKIRAGRARHFWVRLARKKGMMRKKRELGRYSEKMVTVTVPHFALGDARTEPCDKCKAKSRAKRCKHFSPYADVVGQRVDVLHRAWRFFLVGLERWWKRITERTGFRPLLHRAFEWTQGSDGLGHPHMHAWCLSPYLPVDAAHARVDRTHKRFAKWQASRPDPSDRFYKRWADQEARLPRQPNLKDLWRSALRKAGLRTIDASSEVVVNVLRIETRPEEFRHEYLKGNLEALEMSKLGAIDYMVGWNVAEAMGDGKVITVQTAARLYEALEGRRIVQATPGFLEPRGESYCLFCAKTPEGAERGSLRVTYLAGVFGERYAAQRGPPLELVKGHAS